MSFFNKLLNKASIIILIIIFQSSFYSIKAVNKDHSYVASHLWPNGIIPYEIHSNFTPVDRAQLEKGIRDFHEKTCLRWVPSTGQTFYVHFKRVKGSVTFANENVLADASVGYTGGNRTARFGDKYDGFHTMVHEMAHSVGFFHEHERADRDEYLSLEGCNKTKSEKDAHYNFGHLYDYRSISHYAGYGGSCARLKGVTETKSTIGLSILDAEKLNDAYDCRGCFSYRFRFPKEILEGSGGNPVVVGFDENEEPLYSCRAYVNGDIVLGRTKLGRKSECLLPYENKEFREVDMNKFEVLTNPHEAFYFWVKGKSSRNTPTGAIAGGRAENEKPIYVARCKLTVNGKEILLPGKLHNNWAYVSHNGAVHKCKEYEALVCLSGSSVTDLFLHLGIAAAARLK